jgi:hypothetical protein
MGWIALALVGCSRPADRPPETADAEATAMADAPAAIALADIAGTWSVRSTLRDDPSKGVTYDLKATEDRSGWSITFPGRDPIPLRVVAVEGDSIVTEAGPFASEMRKGVQAHSRVVTRLEGDKMVGSVFVRYETSGPDTVATLELEGTRKE